MATTMSKEDAKMLGILTPETGKVSSRFQSNPVFQRTALNKRIDGGLIVLAVPLRVQFSTPDGDVDEEVVGDVVVSPGEQVSAMGVSHMKNIKTFKIKFR
jgi:hypothetical protein